MTAPGKKAADALRTFASDVASGFFEISHSGLALVGVTVVLALSMRVRFDTPLGYSVPTQLAFVPLVFAVPGALVPLVVMLAWVLAGLPEVVRGDTPPSRLLFSIPNSSFSIGPVA